MNMRIHVPVFHLSQLTIEQAMRFRLLDWLNTVIDDDRRLQLNALYLHYRDLFDKLPASATLHQTWPGGLKDHLAVMCWRAWAEYGLNNAMCGENKYTWDSVIVAIFCHDAEKLSKYAPAEDPRTAPYHATLTYGAGWEDVKWAMLHDWHDQFGLELTHDEWNAVKYTHGEGADYTKTHRVSGPLAAMVGNVDRWSAREFPDFGRGMG